MLRVTFCYSLLQFHHLDLHQTDLTQLSVALKSLHLLFPLPEHLTNESTEHIGPIRAQRKSHL